MDRTARIHAAARTVPFVIPSVAVVTALPAGMENTVNSFVLKVCMALTVTTSVTVLKAPHVTQRLANVYAMWVIQGTDVRKCVHPVTTASTASANVSVTKTWNAVQLQEPAVVHLDVKAVPAETHARKVDMDQTV
jgi:hypothetical protein